ncbi:jg17088 [Pararge aegeria aegeria]|uniref:Jg17088 protein n=1 Tax=Pararge aegeria aegeria TaxID=348720 RepID=A0A8S4R3E7_9NEOP|nr:jg17088 [Pararge aegeria aegeria]
MRAVSLTDVTAQITPTSVTSPVSTAAKLAPAVPKMAVSEPDVAFPAVLKGSQKPRVPPPVPPRGSPKTKRGGGGGISQASIETKGEYQNLHISVNEIPAQTPITSSDDDFGFYGHDTKFRKPACRIPPSISDHSLKVTKLVASNSFLGYADEGESITERNKPGKDLIAQSTMMAKFNIDNAVREHLDTGDYDDASFTDSSSDEIIIVHEIGEGNKVIIDTLDPKSKHLLSALTPVESGSETHSYNNESPKTSLGQKMKSSLMSRINTLKKIPTVQRDMNLAESEIDENQKRNQIGEKNKSGLMYGLSKKFNFNQSKKDKNRELPNPKSKPKIEIKPYTEEHSRGNANKDEVVCHKKAKSKIDLFQKHILKIQAEDSCSVASSRDSILSTAESRDLFKETKKVFEPEPPKAAPTLNKRPNYNKKRRAPDPLFIAGAPLSCCSTPPPPFEESLPPRTSRTNSSSTTSSSASGRRRGASSAASVMTTSSASSLALTPAALSSARSNEASVCWTPPASVEGSTPTWTEGTPSFTESSSSEQGYPITPGRGPTPSSDRRSPRPAPPPRATPINCLTSEMVEITHLTSETSSISISTYEVQKVMQSEGKFS